MNSENQTISPGFSRMLVLAAATLITAYGLFLSLGSQAGFPDSAFIAGRMPYLADKPLGEDAFYMIHVAWNLASGHGPVCNEGCAVTGIQPLATLAYAMLAWVDIHLGGDKWTFLRLVLMFNVLLLLAFSEFVGRIAATLSTRQKRPAYCLGFLFSVFAFVAFRHFTLGLETGLYLTALAATMLFSLRHIPFQTLRCAVGLGVLAGTCGWCRIDFGVCFAVFLLAMLCGKMLTLKQCLISGSVAALIIAPWFVWVYSVSGSPMPSSGAAEFELITRDNASLRLAAIKYAFVDGLVPWLFAGSRPAILDAKSLSLLIGLVVLAIWHRKLRGVIAGGRVWLGWMLAVAALASVYPTFFWSAHFYARYMAPLLIITAAFSAVAGVTLAAGVLDRPRGVLAIGSLLCCMFAGQAFGSLHNHRSWFGYSVMAGFVQRNLAHVKQVGAFQSGTMGFFNPNVVNLDGKVNPAVLPFIRNGQITAYIDNMEIGALVDWTYCLRTQYHLPADWLAQKWYCSTNKPDTSFIRCPADCYLRRSEPGEARSIGVQ
ncbi:MAG: hypothetical protein ACOYOU_02545 [Kiritimatiellia bacterium]